MGSTHVTTDTFKIENIFITQIFFNAHFQSIAILLWPQATAALLSICTD